MSNSMRQLANLLISFVDKTLVPLIQAKMIEASKAMDQWNQVKAFIYDSEQIQIWKMQKFLVDMPLKPSNYEPKKAEVSVKQMQPIRAPVYENEPWKQPTDLVQTYQLERKENYTSPVYGNFNGDNGRVEDKGESRLNLESFESLLSSFRKLCTNFENNHKKLVMDREGFLH